MGHAGLVSYSSFSLSPFTRNSSDEPMQTGQGQERLEIAKSKANWARDLRHLLKTLPDFEKLEREVEKQLKEIS